MGERPGRLLGSLALLASLGLGSGRAWAEPSAIGPRILDDTALMLSRGEGKFGPIAIEYGLLDEIQLTTYPVPWLVLAPNLGVKLRPIHIRPVDVAISGEFLYVSTGNPILSEILVDLPPIDLFITPLELAATVHVRPDVAASIAAHSTVVSLLTEIDEPDFQLIGGAATTSIDTRAMVEWRIARSTSLFVRGRYLIAQLVRADASASVQLDEFTRLDARAAASSDILDFSGGFQVATGSLVSWDAFSLRTGIGYGNFVVPIVELWTPSRGLVADLDFYWRF